MGEDPVVIMKALADLLTHVRGDVGVMNTDRWHADVDEALAAAHRWVEEQTGETPARLNVNALTGRIID